MAHCDTRAFLRPNFDDAKKQLNVETVQENNQLFEYKYLLDNSCRLHYNKIK